MSTPIRTPLRISYSPFQKHKNRGDLTWFCRVREAGVSPMDVNLHTSSKAQAEAYAMLRKQELALFNAKVLTGEATEDDLSKLVRKNNPSLIAQKGASKAVSLLGVCLDGWERELRRVGRREKTVAAYTRALRVIIPKECTTADMTVDQQRLWLSKFDDHKSATRRFYSVTLREFSKYCAKYYGTSREPVDDYVHVKVEQTERPWLTMQQIYHLIEAVECKDQVRQKVAKAYYWLLATTGARQGEAYELRWGDLSDDNVLTFRAEVTKNNRTRRVPLDWRIARLIRRLPVEGSRIFAAMPRSQAGRFKILSRAAEKVGLSGIGLHTLRHSASMAYYSKTTDLKATAELLGHQEATALKYYQASRQADQLRETVDKTFEDEHMLPSPIQELAELDLL